jgi:hypothetical protein
MRRQMPKKVDADFMLLHSLLPAHANDRRASRGHHGFNKLAKGPFGSSANSVVMLSVAQTKKPGGIAPGVLRLFHVVAISSDHDHESLRTSRTCN